VPTASPGSTSSATPGIGERQVTCGGRTFPASGLEAPPGAETASGPEFDALRAALATFASEFPRAADRTWRLAGRDASGTIFVALTDAVSAPRWLSVEASLQAGGWKADAIGQCDPRVALSADLGPATWSLDPAFPPPGAASTELRVLVWERACASGNLATGRISAPAIDYGPSTVLVTVGVRPLAGAQRCQGNPGTPALFRLSEPLGSRTLLDGGSVPPAVPAPPF
jgi:hypothetical protein